MRNKPKSLLAGRGAAGCLARSQFCGRDIETYKRNDVARKGLHYKIQGTHFLAPEVSCVFPQTRRQCRRALDEHTDRVRPSQADELLLAVAVAKMLLASAVRSVSRTRQRKLSYAVWLVGCLPVCLFVPVRGADGLSKAMASAAGEEKRPRGATRGETQRKSVPLTGNDGPRIAATSWAQ